MNEAIRVLIVEDDPMDAELMTREFRRDGLVAECVRVQTEREYLAELDRKPDVILSDSSLPEFDGLEALDLLNKRGLDIPFILVSGRVGEDFAVEAMKRGACDYLLKDRLARLGEAVRRAVEQRRLRMERAWAVEALRQSEERYRLVSEASSDYVYSLVVNPEGSVSCEWITEPFTRITGFNAAQINARGWASLYHADDEATTAVHLERLLGGSSASMEVRIVTGDGRVRWIRVHERPVFSKENAARVERIYGAAQDITEQKGLEEQLRHSQKMEAIGQLAGGVAHDFNNLLTVICGYADLLIKRLSFDEVDQEYSEEILRAAKRAAQLTRQLLAFGRRQQLDLKPIDLGGVVRDLEKMLRPLIGEDTELRILRAPDTGLVRADRGQMEQVIMNLAVNARDAMPGGGKLTIETENVEFEGRACVMLAVSDTGSGMTSETAAHIFEPFFTTKEAGKGTGLGLAVVYGIVSQSSGEIRVDSEPGKGATFRIYLPRMDKAGEETNESEPIEPGAITEEGPVLMLKNNTTVFDGDVRE